MLESDQIPDEQSGRDPADSSFDEIDLQRLESELRSLLLPEDVLSRGEPTSVKDFVPKIGKYEILSLLAHGSQSFVFLAFDPDVQRKVVVKLYPSEISAAGLERVQREARSLASRLAELPAFSSRAMKRVLNQVAMQSIETALELETEATVAGFLDPETTRLLQDF